MFLVNWSNFLFYFPWPTEVLPVQWTLDWTNSHTNPQNIFLTFLLNNMLFGKCVLLCNPFFTFKFPYWIPKVVCGDQLPPPSKKQNKTKPPELVALGLMTTVLAVPVSFLEINNSCNNNSTSFITTTVVIVIVTL